MQKIAEIFARNFFHAWIARPLFWIILKFFQHLIIEAHFIITIDKWKKNLFGNQSLTRFTAEIFANFYCCEKSKFVHALWTNDWMWLFASRKSVAKIIYLYSWIFFEYTGFARWKFSPFKKFPFYIKVVYKK